MANPSVIETLIELTTQQSEEAAKRLGQATRQSEQAQEKLDLLQQYRQEYVDQLQTQMSNGLSVAGHANFLRFIQGLDRAISQQDAAVLQSKYLVERERDSWREHERKRLSYGTLVQRAQQQALRQANRQDQKQTDERAARRRSQLG